MPDGRPRRAASVRFRVTALAAAATLGVLVVAAVALVAAHRRALTDGVDEALDREADRVATAVALGTAPPVAGDPDDDDVAAQVVRAGEVVSASPNAGGAGPFAPPPPDGRSEVVRTVGSLPVDDGAFRVLSRRVAGAADDGDGPLVVHVAAGLDDVDESAAALAGSLTVAVPAVVAVLAALVWWLVGRTLRPVEAIRAEVAGIGGRDLHRRVPVAAGGDEVARLATTMNGMLDRLESASERQQRFVADASHELRSPLARIRSEVEVDLAHPEGADPLATHRSVLDEVTGLQRLVDDLLHLARCDAGAAGPVPRTPVDVDDLVLDAAGAVRAGGRVAVDVAGVSGAQVPGDAAQLRRAIVNLVDNAARHARSTVALSVAERDGSAVLTVTDDGPGIPPDQAERVFERFTRLDGARSTATGGAGLGLAIARDVVERHGGTLVLDGDHRPGARFVVTLPLSTAAPGTAPGDGRG